METTQQYRISLNELADAGTRLRESFPPRGDGKPLEAEYLESLGFNTDALKAYVLSGLLVAAVAPQYGRVNEFLDNANDETRDEFLDLVFAMVGGTLQTAIAAVLLDREERGL